MGIVIERKWRCESCDAIHDTEDSAIDCCPPTVHEVFLCPKCGSACDDEEEAIDCCDTDRDDIVSTDDGKRFPKSGAHMSTAEYLAAYCELNKVKT